MIIVDGSSLCHRVLNTPQGELVTSGGQPSGGVHGFLISLGALCKKRRYREGVVVAWDSGVPLHRREIFPEYKPSKMPDGDNIAKSLLSKSNCNPEALPEDKQEFLKRYAFTRNILNKLLPKLGCISVQVENTEADDIIALWCNKIKDDTLTILSTDRDLYQLLDDNTEQYNGTTKEFMTKDLLIQEWELSPSRWREHFMLTKSLIGDSSDGIPSPADGVGGTSATRYAEQMIKLLDGIPMSEEAIKNVLPELVRPPRCPSKGYDNIKLAHKEIWRNYCLTDLYYPIVNRFPMVDAISSAFARTSYHEIDEHGANKTLESLEMHKAKESLSDIIESNANDDLKFYLNKLI